MQLTKCDQRTLANEIKTKFQSIEITKNGDANSNRKSNSRNFGLQKQYLKKENNNAMLPQVYAKKKQNITKSASTKDVRVKIERRKIFSFVTMFFTE